MKVLYVKNPSEFRYKDSKFLDKPQRLESIKKEVRRAKKSLLNMIEFRHMRIVQSIYKVYMIRSFLNRIQKLI